MSVAGLSPPKLQRAEGRAAVSLRRPDGSAATRLHRLHQAGCLKLRFPRLGGAAMEGVLVNTAGGLAGGDRLAVEASVETGAAFTLTTQAAERVYRSTGDDASLATHLHVAPDASLRFLPQETIIFDGGRLRRRLDVDLGLSSQLLLCESVILGRTLMGETVREGSFRDSWRIRRDGRLVFAEEVRLAGAIDALSARGAALGGARAFATILMQDEDVEAMLPQARARLGTEGGASLVEGFLVARLVAETGFALRRRLVPLLAALAKGRLPRVWSL